MSKWTTECIGKMKEVLVTATEAAKAGVPNKSYIDQRMMINSLAIQALIGAEYKVTRKGEYKFKFNKPIPEQKEIFEVASVIDQLVALESKYKVAEENGDDDEDVIIPDDDLLVIPEKVKQKDLNGIATSINVQKPFFTGTDCIAIAAMGADARKRRNRAILITIIAGTVVLAAGATIAIVLCTKDKDEDEDDVLCNECEIPEEDAGDMPIVEA